MSHGLSADVFLDRHRVVGTTFHGGIVGHKQALSPVNHADARDDSCGVRSSVIEVVSSQRGEFEEGCSRVNNAFDTLSRQVLPT